MLTALRRSLTKEQFEKLESTEKNYCGKFLDQRKNEEKRRKIDNKYSVISGY